MHPLQELLELGLRRDDNRRRSELPELRTQPDPHGHGEAEVLGQVLKVARLDYLPRPLARKIANHRLAQKRLQRHPRHIRPFVEVFVRPLGVGAIVGLALDKVHPGPIGHKFLHLYAPAEKGLAVQILPVDLLLAGNHIVRQVDNAVLTQVDHQTLSL